MSFNENNRSVNVSKNVLSSFLNKMAIMLITFITRRLFIQYIGEEYLGINQLFADVLTLLSLADLGLGTAINVSLYKPIAQRNEKRLSALLNYYKKLYYIISAGIFCIGMSLIPFLKYIVNMDKNIPGLYIFYVIYVIKSSVSYLFVYKSSIIRADQKLYKVNNVEIFVNIVKVIIQLFIVAFLHSYLAFILADVMGVIAHNLIVSFIADKEYPFIKTYEKVSAKDIKEIKENVSSIFLYKICWSLLNGTDSILISVLAGTIYVGRYGNYHSITTTIEAFITLLFASFTASVGNLVASAKIKSRYETFNMLQMMSFWICGIVTVCLFTLMQSFVKFWVGPKLLLDNITVIAIIVNLYFSTCMRPVWTFREGTGMYRQIKYIMAFTALLNIIFSIVLGKMIGLSGILFATVISKMLTYFWYEPYILFKKFFKENPLNYYKDFFVNLALLIVGILITYFINLLIKNDSFVAAIIKTFVGFVVINAIYFIKYKNTSSFKSAMRIIRRLIGMNKEK